VCQPHQCADGGAHGRRYPGNFALPGKLCVADMGMAPFIKGSQGWGMIAEGHGGAMPTKVGYVSSTVGSSLLLQVRPLLAGAVAGADRRAACCWPCAMSKVCLDGPGAAAQPGIKSTKVLCNAAIERPDWSRRWTRGSRAWATTSPPS
jgi:hypothetical protein